MTLDKGVEHGKEHREPYRKSKAFDRSCRNHGSCGRCEGDRTHCNHKRQVLADDQLMEVLKDMASNSSDLPILKGNLSREEIYDDGTEKNG